MKFILNISLNRILHERLFKWDCGEFKSKSMQYLFAAGDTAVP